MSLLKPLKDNFEIRIQHAKKGDIASSKYLLGRAAELLKEGEALPPALLEWLTSGLTAIANTEGDRVNANKAFNLCARGGAPKKLSEDWQEMLAREIHDSSLGHHKAESAYSKRKGAYTKAAEDYGISATTAETIYKKYEEGFLIDDELKRLK